MFRKQLNVHTLLGCDFSVSFQDDWLRVVWFNRIILLRFAIWCQRFSFGLIRLNVPFFKPLQFGFVLGILPKDEPSLKIQFFSRAEIRFSCNFSLYFTASILGSILTRCTGRCWWKAAPQHEAIVGRNGVFEVWGGDLCHTYCFILGLIWP